MPPLPGSCERTHCHEILQIPGRGCTRCSGHGDVVLHAETPFEPVRPFTEHAFDHLGLPVVQPVAELLVESVSRTARVPWATGDLEEAAGKALA